MPRRRKSQGEEEEAFDDVAGAEEPIENEEDDDDEVVEEHHKWIPPDPAIAEENARSALVMKLTKDENGVWDMSTAERFPSAFFTKPWELEAYGIGVVIYFKFLLYFSLVTFITGAITGYQTYINVTGEGGEQADSWVVRLTHGNLCTEEERLSGNCEFEKEEIKGLHLACMGIWVITLLWYGWKVQSQAKLVNKRNITSNDYAVWVSNLPRDATDVDEVKAYFEGVGEGAKVHHVGLAMNVGELVKTITRKEELIDEVDHWEAFKKKTGKDSTCCGGLAKSQEELRKESTKVSALANPQYYHNVGHAFVCYDEERGRTHCLRKFNRIWYEKLLDCICCKPFLPPKFREVDLKVVPAPEPSDIFWENLEFPQHKRHKRQILSPVVSMILVGLSLLAVHEIQKWKREQPNSLTSIITAVVVVVVNKVLVWAIINMVRFERHKTRTEAETATIFRLLAAQMSNMTIVIFILNRDKDSWYIQSGLSEEVFYIILSNAFLHDLIEVISPIKIKLWWQKRTAITQKELNIASLPGEFVLSEKYAAALKTLALAFIYSPLIPCVWLITSLGLLASYFADMYKFTRMSIRPPQLDDSMGERCREIMTWMAGAYIVFAGIFYGWSEMWSAALAIWVLYLLLPISKLFRRTNLEQGYTDGKLYSESKHLDRYNAPGFELLLEADKRLGVLKGRKKKQIAASATVYKRYVFQPIRSTYRAAMMYRGHSNPYIHHPDPYRSPPPQQYHQQQQQQYAQHYHQQQYAQQQQQQRPQYQYHQNHQHYPQHAHQPQYHPQQYQQPQYQPQQYAQQQYYAPR